MVHHDPWRGLWLTGPELEELPAWPVAEHSMRLQAPLFPPSFRFHHQHLSLSPSLAS